jgi:hypothetical protein
MTEDEVFFKIIDTELIPSQVLASRKRNGTEDNKPHEFRRKDFVAIDQNGDKFNLPYESFIVYRKDYVQKHLACQVGPQDAFDRCDDNFDIEFQQQEKYNALLSEVKALSVQSCQSLPS